MTLGFIVIVGIGVLGIYFINRLSADETALVDELALLV